VRTETDPEDRHRGITCLLVRMDTPGLTVRPIRNMSGSTMFAELFFDDVRVPVENRLGDEGEGWRVTISALAHERSGIAEIEGLKRHLEALKELARRCQGDGRPASESPAVRQRIARIDARIEAMRLNGQRFLTRQLRGEQLGSETSINKLHRAQLEIEIGELALEIQGSAGALAVLSDEAPDEGRWQRFALSWAEVVIGGGTPNIQRNIIAERLLGLPKDRRTERGGAGRPPRTHRAQAAGAPRRDPRRGDRRQPPPRGARGRRVRRRALPRPGGVAALRRPLPGRGAAAGLRGAR
jgi:alkylation response protein AidB-like acyl-CoA dehydrogenase